MVSEAIAIPALTRLFALTSTSHTEAPGSPSWSTATHLAPSLSV